MSPRRQRRLDGLATTDRATSIAPPAAAPTEPADRLPDDETAEHSSARKHPSTREAPRTAGGKHRRAVSLPTALAQQLRARAQELDRFQTDLVLDCIAAAGPPLRQAAADGHASAGPFERPRRRAHRGRTVTTLTLYLSQGEVDAIDDLAHTTAHTRSGLVAAALNHHLSELS